jgi:glycosyltransferase involved in cell wall biosynthesis
LRPIRAATQLRIEVCDQFSRWSEIFVHAIVTPDHAPQAKSAEPDADALIHLLQASQSRPQLTWRELANEVLSSETAAPLDVLPSPPFYGALEQMEFRAPVQYNRLLVTGWLAHSSQKIVRLIAFLDTAKPQPIVHGLSRPDAGMLFKDLINGSNSRFAGHLELPRDAPHPIALRIFADMEDGRRELVFTKRFRPVVVSGSDSVLPSLSRIKFLKASWALWRAGWTRHWPPGQLIPTLQQAWGEYRREAPTRLHPSASPFLPPIGATHPLHVTFFTHNLNLEGAPLIAFEFARHLSTETGSKVQVISPQDGPLREFYEASGLQVLVVDARAMFTAKSTADFNRALDQLIDEYDLSQTDVIAANTMVAFWGVLIAQRLGKPSILYIHESVSARRFFAPHLAPAVIDEAESAFTLASRVVFSAAASQIPHAHLSTQGNFCVIPGWIDTARIKVYAEAHSRTVLRQQLNLPLDAVIFSNVGSVLPRKGQQIYLEAIELLLKARGTIQPPLFFLIVGAGRGPDPYLDILRATIDERPIPGVRIVEQVTDSYAYFQSADIFVCSSYEESFPRVVMEAAAFKLPVVSTNVNGIPEMLDPESAWLVPPGEPAALANAMGAALAAHLSGDTTRAERGQRTVCERFDSRHLLARHTDLLSHIAALPRS